MACTVCQLALGAAPLALWAFRGKPLLDLKGLHVLVTGGSEGLGLSLAEELLKYGARISIVARTQSKLDSAKAGLIAAAEGLGGTPRVAAFAADTTNVEQVKAAVNAAESVHGPVDILICNAGSAKPGYFMEQPVQDFRAMMDVNYFGTLHTIKVVSPGMLERGTGRICIIGSALSLVGFVGYTAYAPSKWALRGLADCLRNEFVGTGVQLSIAYPPDTETPGFRKENTAKPPECMKISEGEVLMQPGKVAKHIVSGIRRGLYHIPPPDFAQELLAAKMASISPMPGSIIVNILLAPVLVIVAFFYSLAWDNTVAKFAKSRAAWKSNI